MHQAREGRERGEKRGGVVNMWDIGRPSSSRTDAKFGGLPRYRIRASGRPGASQMASNTGRDRSGLCRSHRGGERLRRSACQPGKSDQWLLALVTLVSSRGHIRGRSLNIRRALRGTEARCKVPSFIHHWATSALAEAECRSFGQSARLPAPNATFRPSLVRYP